MSLILSPKTGKLISTDSQAYEELANDPEYKNYLFDLSEPSTATLQPSGSPVSENSFAAAPSVKLPPAPKFSSLKTNKLPILPASPVYFQKVNPVFSPPSPNNSLADIPMPIPVSPNNVFKISRNKQ